MADRELGAAASTCPNCGNELEAVALPDGGVTVQSCPSCFPAEAEQSDAEQPTPEKAQSEQPMVSREQGTTTVAPSNDEGVNQ